MEGNGGCKVFSDRILRQAPDRIKGSGPQYHIGSTDKGGIESCLSWTQQVIKHGLLIICPTGHRIVQIGIILPGLDPTHLWITKRRNGFEQEVWFGDLIGIKDDDEGITGRLKLLTCMLNLFPVGRLCHTTIITYNDRHPPMRIDCQVLITSRHDAFQCWPENRNALVDSRDKNENWVPGRIFTLLNFWWRPGPDGELKTKHMQSSQNLREEEWYRDPPAMPVRDHKTPAQVVNSRDADCNRQHHHNRLITLDILREHKRGTNKQDRQDEQGTRVRVTNPANRQDHPHHRHYRKKLVGEFFLHQLKFSYWL